MHKFLTVQKNLIINNQTDARTKAASKTSKIAIFDTFDVRKNFVEISAVRFYKDFNDNNYDAKELLDQKKIIIYFIKSMLVKNLRIGSYQILL